MALALEKMEQLNYALRRIFSFKVGRSTFREVQSAVKVCTQDSPSDSQQVIKSLMTGTAEKGNLDDQAYTLLQEIAKEYAIPINLSREVAERGDFISQITSDLLRNDDAIAYAHRVRRVDGEELQFVTDIKGTAQILMHLSARLKELKNTDYGKEHVEQVQAQLEAVKANLEALL